MMTAIFALMSFNPEGWRSVWKAMRHFTSFPDPIQAVLLVWALLVVYAGSRFLIRIIRTVTRSPDRPLPQKSRSA
jgi:hypothetical protein